MLTWPDPKTVAVLNVNGTKYKDWETIMVKQTLFVPPFYWCRFTCSEGMPISKNFAAMQIKPGAYCTVTLGGVLAFTGKVETRQVYYDAHRHYVEIQCASNLEQLSSSSIVKNDMEWIDKH